MTFLQSLILGIIQGVTEFLPISSSGHLVLIPYLLNWKIPEDQIFPFDVLVQMGTLAAIVYCYRDDARTIIKEMVKGIAAKKPFEKVESRIGWLSLLATIPAGAIGILIKPLILSSFKNPVLPAIFLFLTAGLLVAGEVLGKKNRNIDNITWKDALLIGAFQILAVFPGISRSGSTISGGMLRNLKRNTAGQFAFLMAIPIMLAAGIIGVIDMLSIQDLNHFLPIILTGFITSAIVGYFTITWLLDYMRDHSLLAFAAYCLMFGASSLAFSYFNPQAIMDSTTAIDTTSAVSEDGAYQIGYDPDLEWLVPGMNNCQQESEEMPIVYQQYTNMDDTANLFDAYFTYGESNSTFGNIYQIGENQLVIVSHPSQRIQQASIAYLDNIFSGRLNTWQSAAENCPECFIESLPATLEKIEIWTLPDDNLPWEIFEDIFLSSGLSSFANVAPGSKILRQKVAADINTIGLLPSGWLDKSVKEIIITDSIEVNLNLPITVSTTSEPDDTLSNWLNCIQTTLKD